MGFRKTAQVAALGSFECLPDGSLRKRAAANDEAGPRSYYADGDAKIDVRSILKAASSDYAISDDPSDYIFEAIRANTVNVPNENHDAFSRNELLSWNTRLAMPVYMTYRNKPHHVNHRTENPKTARGIIIDAHYNDVAPALENCPTCNHKTAETTGRDPSGIHCSKCGSVVKDEFVEILVAVDTKKDPVFADGVRTGQLKAGSMGCNCAKTACKVCDHVARSRAEFCEHIRAGNKGTLWTKEGDSRHWKRISKAAATKEFSKRGRKFNTTDFCTLHADDGFEVRKAYEECIGVEFDEYSRVDQPADPKALQREILGKAASAVPSSDELRRESEQLIARAQRRTASQFFVVRVDEDEDDTYAAESLEEASAMAVPDPGAKVEYAVVEASDAGTARESVPEEAWMPLGEHELEGDVTINIDEGPGGEEVDMMESPDTSMEDFTEQELAPAPEPAPAPIEEEMSPEEMGVIPPGASKEATAAMSKDTFADAYRNWKVEVTARGNARLVSPHGPVLLVEASAKPNSDADRRSFGREILGHLFDHGLVKTAERYNALFDARFAQVVDFADDDMKEFADKYTKSEVAGGGDNDMASMDRGDMRPDSRDDSDSDNASDMKRTVEVQTSIETHETDHEMSDVASDLSVTKDEDSDMRDGRQPYNMGTDTALDNPENDHVERLAAKKCGECECEPCECASKKESMVGNYYVNRTAKVASGWLAQSYNASRDAFTMTNDALEQREVDGADLLSQWIQLDKGPQANVERRVAEKYEDRVKKLYASKLAAAKKAAKEQVEQARKEERARFARALRIVAKRHALNQELSPLKESMGVALTNQRTVGHDASTGRPLDWQPVSQELAVHLIEAAWKEGGDAQVSALIERATDLMDKDAGYLKDAESDLNKMAHTIPPVTAASMVSDVDRTAEDLRKEAMTGNMQLNPAGGAEVAPTPANGHNRRANIRAALGGGTIVGSNLNQFRPN